MYHKMETTFQIIKPTVSKAMIKKGDLVKKFW